MVLDKDYSGYTDETNTTCKIKSNMNYLNDIMLSVNFNLNIIYI